MNQMMVFILLSISLLIVPSSLPLSTTSSNEPFTHSILFPSHIIPADSSFTPEPLTHQDDAYHTPSYSYMTEWWYFDATLNQGYTLQFSIHIYSIFTTGFAILHCNLYKQGEPVVSDRSFYPLSNLSLSTRTPYVALDDLPLMTCTQTPPAIPTDYTITYETTSFSYDLTFHGTTEGWKGTTSAGAWAVVLPNAEVSGHIIFENTTIPVQGTGYHDHNWNVSLSTGRNFGWLWGKTTAEPYTLIWADILETWYKGTPLLVINEDYNGFHNIPDDHLDIMVTDLQFTNGMILPNGFTITGQSDSIILDLIIEVLDTDYITILGVVNYWRYHVHTTGSLQVNGQQIAVDDYNTAEFIRFRPY